MFKIAKLENVKNEKVSIDLISQLHSKNDCWNKNMLKSLKMQLKKII